MRKAVFQMGILVCLLTLNVSAVRAVEWPSQEAILEAFYREVVLEPPSTFATRLYYQGVIVEELEYRDPVRTETPFVAMADTTGRVWYAASENWADLKEEAGAELPRVIRWLLNPDFARRIPEYFPRLEAAGYCKEGNLSYATLLPGDLQPEHYRLYFGSHDGGLLHRVGFFQTLEEWREVDRILFPHQVEFSRKGGHTIWVFLSARSRQRPDEGN